MSRATAMLAFAAGLLVAALGAGADEPARFQPTAERARTDSVRVQPTAKQFAPPNQPDISDSDATVVDQLYRQLMGPPPATSLDSARVSAFRQRQTMTPLGALGAGRAPDRLGALAA